MRYVDSKVWVIADRGVVGFDLDEMNQYIDMYNREYYRYTDFWTYLSGEIKNGLCWFLGIVA